MPVTTKTDAPAESAVTDRRRPGRVGNVNPALIPLLRGAEPPPGLDPAIDFDEPDQLAGARGIMSGVALSVPLWVGIVVLARWLLP